MPTTRVSAIVNIIMPVLNSVTSHIPIAMLMRPADKKPIKSAVLRLKSGTTNTEEALAIGSIMDIRFKVIVAV